MIYELTNPKQAPANSQHAFAMSLVDSLGLKDALQACRDNSWFSIWEILRNK